MHINRYGSDGEKLAETDDWVDATSGNGKTPADVLVNGKPVNFTEGQVSKVVVCTSGEDLVPVGWKNACIVLIYVVVFGFACGILVALL